MTGIQQGDWVRYTQDFCEEKMSTSMGVEAEAARRGRVVRVFNEGKLCDVDWGDCFVQFSTESPSIVTSRSPFPEVEAAFQNDEEAALPGPR